MGPIKVIPEPAPQAEPVFVTTPAVLICRQSLPEAAAWEEMTRAEVEEVPVTAKLVVVALVDVAFTVVKLVMVDVALFESIPPKSVDSPVAEKIFVAKLVVVALVDVAFTVVRLVMVDVALFESIQPKSVDSPVA